MWAPWHTSAICRYQAPGPQFPGNQQLRIWVGWRYGTNTILQLLHNAAPTQVPNRTRNQVQPALSLCVVALVRMQHSHCLHALQQSGHEGRHEHRYFKYVRRIPCVPSTRQIGCGADRLHPYLTLLCHAGCRQGWTDCPSSDNCLAPGICRHRSTLRPGVALQQLLPHRQPQEHQDHQAPQPLHQLPALAPSRPHLRVHPLLCPRSGPMACSLALPCTCWVYAPVQIPDSVQLGSQVTGTCCCNQAMQVSAPVLYMRSVQTRSWSPFHLHRTTASSLASSTVGQCAARP